MKGFRRLVILLVSCAGFVITCGTLLYKGGSLLDAALRAVVVFVLLNIALNFIGSILDSVAKQEPHDSETPKDAKSES